VDLLCDEQQQSFYGRLGMTIITGMRIRRHELAAALRDDPITTRLPDRTGR
jgi:hypothetical protein